MDDLLKTPGGIEFHELEGYPTGSGSREGRTLQTRWSISWDDLEDLLAELFPETATVGGWTFAAPMTYPGISYLYAKSYSYRPGPVPPEVDTPWDRNHYADSATDKKDSCIVDITFGTASWTEADDGTYRTHDVTIGGEFLRLPQFRMKWEGESAEAKESDLDTGLFIPHVEHSITFPMVPSVSWNTILSKIGKTNAGNDVFANSAEEAVLYLGAQITATTTWKGTRTYRISHRFKERIISGQPYDADEESSESISALVGDIGWNHFFRPEHSRWQRLLLADGSKIYPTTTFAELFASA